MSDDSHKVDRRAFLGACVAITAAPAALLGMEAQAAPEAPTSGTWTVDFEAMQLRPRRTKVFTGAYNKDWGDARNWLDGEIPEDGNSVRIEEGQTALMLAPTKPVKINALVMGCDCLVGLDVGCECTAVLLYFPQIAPNPMTAPVKAALRRMPHTPVVFCNQREAVREAREYFDWAAKFRRWQTGDDVGWGAAFMDDQAWGHYVRKCVVGPQPTLMGKPIYFHNDSNDCA